MRIAKRIVASRSAEVELAMQPLSTGNRSSLALLALIL
jgi:hypothetical protein